MTSKSADRIAEAIKQAITQKHMALRERYWGKGKKTTGRSPALVLADKLRIERNEYEENFKLLLSIVSNMAESGSGDCEAVLAEYSEAYLSSF